MNSWQEEIVITLANHIRVCSLEQIRRTWWPRQRSGKQRATECIQLLEKNKLVRMRKVFSRPIQRLDAPLLFWQHGDPHPDFQAMANCLRRRARTEAEVIPVVTAEPRGRRLFGVGERRTLKLAQITHDLHVAEVFFRYYESGTDVFRHWVGEDSMPRLLMKIRPDALICDDVGGIVRAVEYGGEYTDNRLFRLHEGFYERAMAYEIW